MDWTTMFSTAAPLSGAPLEPAADEIFKSIRASSPPEITDDMIRKSIESGGNHPVMPATPTKPAGPEASWDPNFGTPAPAEPEKPVDVSAMGNYKAKYSPEQYAQLLQAYEDKQAKHKNPQDWGNVAAGFLGGFSGLKTATDMDKSRAEQEALAQNRFKDQNAYGVQYESQLETAAEKTRQIELKKRLVDPNSVESQSAFDNLWTIAGTHPELREELRRIPMDQRTAVNLTAKYPAYKEVISNAINMQKSADSNELRRDISRSTLESKEMLNKALEEGRNQRASDKAEAKAESDANKRSLDIDKANAKFETAKQAELKRYDSAESLANQAEVLLNSDPTHSGIGSKIDAAGNWSGVGPTAGGRVAAQLKVVGGQMMMNTPRFEGPQSDKDTMVYKQMAGNIADDTKSIGERLDALTTIREITARNRDLTLAMKPPVPGNPDRAPYQAPAEKDATGKTPAPKSTGNNDLKTPRRKSPEEIAEYRRTHGL